MSKKQYRKNFEPLPREFKEILHGREIEKQFIHNLAILETLDGLESDIISARVFKNMLNGSSLYVHCYLKIMAELFKRDLTPDDIVRIPNIMTGESDSFYIFLGRELIDDILKPYIKQVRERRKQKNITVPDILRAINAVDVMYEIPTIGNETKRYRHIKPIVIDIVETGIHRNSSNFWRAEKLKVTLHTDTYNNYMKCKESNTNGLFIPTPTGLYESISENTQDNEKLLNNAYNLYLCGIANNTNNVNKIVRPRQEIMKILPNTWTKQNKRDKDLRVTANFEKLREDIDEIGKLTHKIKQDMDTDIKLIKNIYLGSNEEDGTIYFE